jgi:hypothetical protein
MQRAGIVLRICPEVTAERDNPMPEATEQLHSNLHNVFSERDPERRWAAIGRTYNEDVTFIDPDGEFVGWQEGRVSTVQTLIAPPSDA